MKSAVWLTERIMAESLHKQDISSMRELMQQGKSDEEILVRIRKKMVSNSKSMRAYIRHEKVRALMVKLSYGIHWVCLLPVIENWLTEKEALIRWRESDHSGKIQEKARELKNKLTDPEYKKMKFDCANGEGLPEKVMEMIEKAAEGLLLQIEEEERERLRYGREDAGPHLQAESSRDTLHLREKDSSSTGDSRQVHACRESLRNGIQL